MKKSVADMSAATKWPPSVVWETSYEDLELVGSALMRRSGKPYVRKMTEAELEEKAEISERMRRLGLVK